MDAFECFLCGYRFSMLSLHCPGQIIQLLLLLFCSFFRLNVKHLFNFIWWNSLSLSLSFSFIFLILLFLSVCLSFVLWNVVTTYFVYVIVEFLCKRCCTDIPLFEPCWLLFLLFCFFFLFLCFLRAQYNNVPNRNMGWKSSYYTTLYTYSPMHDC